MNTLLHYATKVFTDKQWKRIRDHAGDIPLTGVDGLRRLVASKSIEAFMLLYFPDKFTLELAPIHHQMIADLEEIKRRAINKEHGIKYVRVLPRGISKTTIYALILPLHALLYGYSPLTVVLGNTQTAASRLIRNIKTMIESNEAIKTDFPDIRSNQWNTEILTATNGCSITGYGADSGAIRGMSTALSRPTLVIGDDLDDDSSVRSQVMTESMIEWWDKAVMQMGDNVTFTTSFIVSGTLIRKTSLLQHIIDSNDFNSVIKRGVIQFAQDTQLWNQWEEQYKALAREERQPSTPYEDTFYQNNKTALLQGTEVLWNRDNAYYEMMIYKLARGTKAFNSEIQNQITNDKGSFLAPTYVTEPIDEATYDLLFSFDSAIKGNDYNAAVEVLFNRKIKELIVRYSYAKQCGYAEAIDDLSKRILGSTKRYDGIFVEVNSAGQMVSDLLAQKIGIKHYRPVEITSRIKKEERIELISEYMRNGQIRFMNIDHPRLLEEMSYWPQVKHDDALDSLSLVVLYLHEKGMLQLVKPLSIQNGVRPM